MSALWGGDWVLFGGSVGNISVVMGGWNRSYEKVVERKRKRVWDGCANSGDKEEEGKWWRGKEYEMDGLDGNGHFRLASHRI